MLNDSITKPFLLAGVCLFWVGVYLLIFLFRIKLNRADYFTTIQTAQRLVALVCSALIWGIAGISVGTVLWLILFVILRQWIFRINAQRLYELYEKHEKCGSEYPVIRKVAQWKDAYFSPSPSKKTNARFKYHFSQHIASCASLLFLWMFRITCISRISIPVYVLEFLILATVIYIFVGKIIYRIALFSPSSLLYLSPGLSYIPVFFVGIVYYYIAVVILVMTLP